MLVFVIILSFFFFIPFVADSRRFTLTAETELNPRLRSASGRRAEELALLSQHPGSSLKRPEQRVWPNSLNNEYRENGTSCFQMRTSYGCVNGSVFISRGPEKMLRRM